MDEEVEQWGWNMGWMGAGLWVVGDN